MNLEKTQIHFKQRHNSTWDQGGDESELLQSQENIHSNKTEYLLAGNLRCMDRVHTTNCARTENRHARGTNTSSSTGNVSKQVHKFAKCKKMKCTIKQYQHIGVHEDVKQWQNTHKIQIYIFQFTCMKKYIFALTTNSYLHMSKCIYTNLKKKLEINLLPCAILVPWFMYAVCCVTSPQQCLTLQCLTLLQDLTLSYSALAQQVKAGLLCSWAYVGCQETYVQWP